ncbi:MAG: ThiF family adenylyltransferase [Deltaproteobacteria bacterium]|nr:ThiF family adenylyltransferase [Deltaproteobacteria bacterium]
MKDIRLVVKENDWKGLLAHLLKPNGLERQAFLDLGYDEDTGKIYLHRVSPLEDKDYEDQSPYFVKPKGQAVVKAYESFLDSGIPIQGHVHSHPFCSQATLSNVDRRTLMEMAKGLAGVIWAKRAPQESLCFQMVVGRDPAGFQGYLLDLPGNTLGTLSQIRVIGSTGIRLYGKEAGGRPESILLDERFDRNIRWLGKTGQARLTSTHLAICGLGGAGALVAANIRGLGFGEITLIDPDRVEKSNLNRLVGASLSDVGSLKVEVAERVIREVMPDTVIHAFGSGVEDPMAQALLRRADVIISAVDGLGPRAELQILAARHLKPLIDIGSGILVSDGKVRRMGSQIIFYQPGGPCLACQGMDLFRPSSVKRGRA